jgi:hypothetical protein
LRATNYGGSQNNKYTMDYSPEIKICIAEIGNSKINFNRSKDNYLFNNKVPREIPSDFYEILYNKFESFLLVQIREGLIIEQIEEYILNTKNTISKLISTSDGHRIHFLFSKRDKILSNEAESTHFEIANIISTQKAVLNRVLLKLYTTIDSYKENKIDDFLSEEIPNIDSSLIKFDSVGKVTFKLSKKESLMFLYILEQVNLLEFESIEQRRLFIENNFNFTETRNNPNKGNALPMKGISSELSDFSSYAEGDSNNKTLEKLLNKLQETIHHYEFNNLKAKKK